MNLRSQTKYSRNITSGSSLVFQWVKDPGLSLLWLGFHPWARNFRMLQVWQKKKRKEKKYNFTFP